MLIGNVGTNPELKHTPSGIPVVTLVLATSETWKDKDGRLRENTDWHNVVAWRGLAEVIDKMITKGSRIFIEGSLKNRNIEDRQGNKKFVTEVLADNMLILDTKRHYNANGESPDQHSQNGSVNGNYSDSDGYAESNGVHY
jgi:single-strand DNA-binding protein